MRHPLAVPAAHVSTIPWGLLLQFHVGIAVDQASSSNGAGTALDLALVPGQTQARLLPQLFGFSDS